MTTSDMADLISALTEIKQSIDTQTAVHEMVKEVIADGLDELDTQVRTNTNKIETCLEGIEVSLRELTEAMQTRTQTRQDPKRTVKAIMSKIPSIEECQKEVPKNGKDETQLKRMSNEMEVISDLGNCFSTLQSVLNRILKNPKTLERL